MKKSILILLMVTVALGSSFEIHGNIFKDAIHWIKKEGKKAVKWSKGAFKDVESKFSKYGSQAVSAVEDIGEDAWNKLKNFDSCANVVVYGTEYSSAEAAYQSAKAAAHNLGPAAQKLGALGSDAINKGVNIKKIAFKAQPAAAFEKGKGKAIDFEIEGSVFGKSINTDVELDFAQVKSATDFAQQVFNQIF